MGPVPQSVQGAPVGWAQQRQLGQKKAGTGRGEGPADESRRLWKAPGTAAGFPGQESAQVGETHVEVLLKFT